MIYDSRDPGYKYPYGAVPSGTEIALRISPPRSLGVGRAVLCANFEASSADYEIPMEWKELRRGNDIYGISLETGEYVGLIWYYFKIECADGTLYLDKSGCSGHFGERMQITVYDPSFRQISWFGEGVVYQIFPDRFCRTSVPPAPEGKHIHEDWDELPAFTPRTDPCTGREVWNYDFFGGSLDGIISKLDYLRTLGVTILYLNPIFEAFSNHRYDTGDYERIDPLLGDTDDFRRLCAEAHDRGMRVILDGVFNHTGDDSRYFNRRGRYPGAGAYQSPDSPYYGWFEFQEYPEKYSAWWGIGNLPSVNEMEPSYVDYIIEAPDSIVRRWLREGADGWRLDVADELPDEFIRKLNSAAKAEKADAIIIGEVWEDASNKTSYNVRRRHLGGGHLDCVMNYPFRNAVISYLTGNDAAAFVSAMEELRENYPPAAFMNNMNFLGTHDTPRILTALGAGEYPLTRHEQAGYKMTSEEYEIGKKRLMLAAMIMFAFPGTPTIYYGDEAGVCGGADPFNRTAYPWGREDRELVDRYARLSEIRQGSNALKRGDIRYYPAEKTVLAFSRCRGDETVLAVTNAGNDTAAVSLPRSNKRAVDLLSGESSDIKNGVLSLPPLTGALLRPLPD